MNTSSLSFSRLAALVRTAFSILAKFYVILLIALIVIGVLSFLFPAEGRRLDMSSYEYNAGIIILFCSIGGPRFFEFGIGYKTHLLLPASNLEKALGAFLAYFVIPFLLFTLTLFFPAIIRDSSLFPEIFAGFVNRFLSTLLLFLAAALCSSTPFANSSHLNYKGFLFFIPFLALLPFFFVRSLYAYVSAPSSNVYLFVIDLLLLVLVFHRLRSREMTV